jgi:uncharacterized protein
MPEYLAPGVYVEETSFRSKSIEGVSTSTAAFIGPTAYGPTEGTPELLTSFADFARIYGGIDNIELSDESQVNYMAHAVRAFFDNGGSRLYVTRVYEPTPPEEGEPTADTGKALAVIGSPDDPIVRARFPGQAGNMTVTFAVRAAANALVSGPALRGIRAGDVVYLRPALSSTVASGLYDVEAAGDTIQLRGPANGTPSVVDLGDLNTGLNGDRAHRITLNVRVRRRGRFEDELSWDGLEPNAAGRDALVKTFTAVPTSRQQYLTVPFQIESDLDGAALAQALVGDDVLDSLGLSLASRNELAIISPQGERPGLDKLERVYTLQGGSDGETPPPPRYVGESEGPEKSGLMTFEDVEDISIVAAPGATTNYSDEDEQGRVDSIVQALLIHCQLRMRYRVAVIDSPHNQVLSEVRDFRGKFDSTHAALYYPWVTVVDPTDPTGRREIDLPPSGFVAGIYARTDVLHGVFKAPANEVVFGAISFERLLNKAQQDVLNPLGINCFRFFDGRGFRLWGARTISSDPEWKYISVRRYFAYLEHSIDRGTQWAVFENNGDRLWANVRRTIEDFLFNEWRSGALLGTEPEQAFFVRCDRSTMTQNDLDNGRLICLIGVAVIKPAEFVIFRIGQMTADSRS